MRSVSLARYQHKFDDIVTLVGNNRASKLRKQRRRQKRKEQEEAARVAREEAQRQREQAAEAAARDAMYWEEKLQRMEWWERENYWAARAEEQRKQEALQAQAQAQAEGEDQAAAQGADTDVQHDTGASTNGLHRTETLGEVPSWPIEGLPEEDGSDSDVLQGVRTPRFRTSRRPTTASAVSSGHESVASRNWFHRTNATAKPWPRPAPPVDTTPVPVPALKSLPPKRRPYTGLRQREEERSGRIRYAFDGTILRFDGDDDDSVRRHSDSSGASLPALAGLSPIVRADGLVLPHMRPASRDVFGEDDLFATKATAEQIKRRQAMMQAGAKPEKVRDRRIFSPKARYRSRRNLVFGRRVDDTPKPPSDWATMSTRCDPG